ncbi:MAG TPA: gas vesicle protein GvpD P-loop domain-containing protein [Thermoplasmata archaeon]|nr:gas vesicle protein GvpD P-loop domain-containing protein [Thermoplasmata archaeon]
MGASLPIPRELVDFLRLPGPQSMLLRGPPGSGKSSLSLALLESFNGARFYVTNRVPEEDVMMAFPWLGQNGHHGIQMLDNTEADGVAQAARALLRGSPALVSDLSNETRELTEFLWLPEPLQEAWGQLDPEHPSLIVIDSWDALVDSYLGTPGLTGGAELPSRADIERALLRRMGRAKTHLLFVLEREEQTQLDYLVNAVGVTSREVVNGRLERWLTLFKLRGVRIENAHYPFSLESAHFECIVPVRAYGHLRGGRFNPAPDQLPGQLWPGSKAFAESFGRLPLGKSSLIEVENEVPNNIPHLLLAPMIANAIERNGHVIVLPDASTLPEDVWDALHGSAQRERFLAQVRFLLPPAGPNEGSSEFDSTIVRLGPSSDGVAPTASDNIGMDQFLRSGSTAESPGLFVVFLNGLVSIASGLGVPITTDTAQRLPGQIQAAVRGAPVHAIAIGSPSSPLLEPLRATAAMRLHLRQVQGRIFLHGSDPWTPSFVLTEGGDNDPYGLLRVV